MTKRRLRYRNDARAICLRCGAPASPEFRGGQLVKVKGVKRQVVGSGHKRREWQHADPRFCARRIPGARRSPTSRDTQSPDVARP